MILNLNYQEKKREKTRLKYEQRQANKQALSETGEVELALSASGEQELSGTGEEVQKQGQLKGNSCQGLGHSKIGVKPDE